MRYFRYKNTDKNVSTALKEQYKTLTEDEKRTFRKKKRWEKFSTIVTLTIFICCIIAEIFLLKSIPVPNDNFLEVLVIVGKVIVGFILLIVSGGLTAIFTTPLWKKVETFDFIDFVKCSSPCAPAKKSSFFGPRIFLSKPQAWHIIAARSAVYIIKGGEPPLHIITRQRASTCGLMIYNASH